MTTVALASQLASSPVTLGDVDCLVVTTFALPTTHLRPLGLRARRQPVRAERGRSQPCRQRAGDAYAMIFVNAADPITVLAIVHDRNDRGRVRDNRDDEGLPRL